MTPIYKQIADDLRRRIEAGEYPPGSRLPGYAELEAQYQVGRNTLAAALKELRKEGRITVEKKSGIKVRERVARRALPIGQRVFRDHIGYRFGTDDIHWETHGRPRRDTVPAPQAVADILGIEEGTPVLRRHRVMSPVGEPPFAIVETYLHPAAVDEVPRVGEADTGKGGYLDRLEEVGHGPMRWTETLRARNQVTALEARALGIPREMAVLDRIRVGFSGRTGEALEVTWSVIPEDRIEVPIEVQRDQTARWPVPPAGTEPNVAATTDNEEEFVPEESWRPEKPPVVAAIVTCSRGILISERRDGRPPWGFISGEVEPGESAYDAAIREVKEETGLLVMASEREIGRRVHPKTGRLMIYLACSPPGKTDIFVGDEDELLQVRWASLAEVEELLPGLYGQVHDYLREQEFGNNHS